MHSVWTGTDGKILLSVASESFFSGFEQIAPLLRLVGVDSSILAESALVPRAVQKIQKSIGT